MVKCMMTPEQYEKWYTFLTKCVENEFPKCPKIYTYETKSCVLSDFNCRYKKRPRFTHSSVMVLPSR